jgi:hypothetical protein
MQLSKYNDETSKPQHNHLKMDRKDLPLTISYGEKTYVLIVTKSEKLLLQKPLMSA